MKIKTLSAFILIISAFPALGTLVQSGSGFEGNALVYYLGKSANSSELKQLQANYNCEMANEAHYLSKSGIELILQKGLLNEIHLYKGSAVYGNYTGLLPNNLRFGMSSAEAKRLLGKPVVSYNSGYCEFELHDYILSCWFDKGVLSQVGLAVKAL